MCGILFRLSKSLPSSKDDHLFKSLQHLLEHRGPDHQATHTLTHSTWRLQFHSTVLHLRGTNNLPTQQPVINNSGDVLCWNGEVFGYKPRSNEHNIPVNGVGKITDLESNDTNWVMNALGNCSDKQEVVDVLGRIRGPYGVVYWQNRTKTLFFGRDVIGRRSLVWTRSHSESFYIASVGVPGRGSEVDTEHEHEWEEIPANGIYALCLDDIKDISTLPTILHHYPWQQTPTPTNPLQRAFATTNTLLPTEKDLIPCEVMTELPSIMSAESEDMDSPTRELQKAVKEFESVLSESVRVRVNSIPSNGHSARLAILFSGGLDCSLLAYYASKHLPPTEPIDLLNVAFENPRINNHHQNQKHKHKKQSSESEDSDEKKYNVPDRLTSRKSLAQLQSLFPDRNWRLIEINIPYTEYLSTKDLILSLMYPVKTVMDLSIAIAFYFAGKGVGKVFVDNAWIETRSTAKVLFSGLGADEQLGGYGRHRVQYQVSGWEGLVTEMSKDVERISWRNLGRDDRVLSHLSKEVRYPFLDEDVMRYLSKLEVWKKCDPRFEKGVGDKILARLLAKWYCGFGSVAVEMKRAVQFGSRTAKMEDSKQKGEDLLV